MRLALPGEWRRFSTVAIVRDGMKTSHVTGEPAGLSAGFGQLAPRILALFPPLSEAEQRISLSLYRLLAGGDAVPLEGLARAAGLAAEEVERALRSWPDVRRSPNGSVVGYGGLTIKATRHRLHFRNRVLYA